MADQRPLSQVLLDAIFNAVSTDLLMGALTDETTEPVLGITGSIQTLVAAKAANYMIDVVNREANAAKATTYQLAPVERRPPYKMWVAERDACVDCLAYSGEHVAPGAEFPKGRTYGDKPISESAYGGQLPEPPLHPNCVIPSTRVVASQVRAVTDRHYAGEVVVLQTRSGKELTVTVNHPVLTARGWVAAGLLHEGDEVVSSRRREWSRAVNPDNGKGPTRIQDVARSLQRTSTVSSVKVPVAAPDFHGDGEGSEVAVVWSDGPLRDDRYTALAQVLRNDGFEVGVVPALRLPGLRSGTQRLVARGAAPDGLVGGSNETGPLLGARAGHADEHGLAASTAGDATLVEPAVDDPAADTEAISKALDALSGEVVLDPLVSVWRRDYAGHVMNLETGGGWYLAEGIVTHNCRCEVVPYDPAAETGSTSGADALKHEAQRSVLKGWGMDSESNAARARAAERLLESDPDLPKSVKEQARRRLRRGDFTTTEVP